MRPLAVSCGVFLVSYYLFSLFSSDLKPAIAIAASLCLVVLCVCSALTGASPLKIARGVSLVLLVPVILSLLLSFFAFDIHYNENADRYSGEHDIEAVVTEQTYNESFYAVYRVCLISVDGEEVNLRAVLTTDFASSYDNGDRIAVNAKLSPSCEGVSLSERYDLSKGYVLDAECTDDNGIEYLGRMSVFPYTLISDIRGSLSGALSSMLEGDSLRLAKALTYGDGLALTFAAKNDFRALGISHALAISGLHLGIVMTSMTFVLSRLGLRKKIRYCITLLLGLFYVFILGFSPSVFRAYLMLCGMAAASFARRKRDGVTTLLSSAALICLLSPYSIIDVGLHLSFFSTLGILTVALPISEKVSYASKNRVVRYIVSAFTITLSALTFTMPYSIYYFASLPLLAPITNLIFLPMITLLVYLLPLLLLSYFVPFLSYPIAFLFSAVSGAVLRLADLLYSATGGLSIDLSGDFAFYAGLAMIAAVIFCLLFFRKKRAAVIPPALYILSILVLTLVSSLTAQGKESAYFATNQSSDAIVIKSSDRAAVIDNSYGGYSFLSSVMDGSANIADGGIDLLVIAHYHEYSISSLGKLIDKYRISTVILIKPAEYDEFSYNMISALSSVAASRETVCLTVSEGETIEFGGCKAVVTLLKSGGAHTLARIDVTCGDASAAYFPPGAPIGQISKAAEDFDQVVIGNHGNNFASLPLEIFKNDRIRAIDDGMQIHK